MKPIDQVEFQIADLAARVIQGTANHTQQVEFDNWLAEDPQNRLWFESFQQPKVLTQNLEQLKKFDSDIALSQVYKRIQKPRQISLKWSLGIAASFALFMLTFVLKMNQPKELTEDALPGFNQARITLSDGQVVSLDSNQKGFMVVKNGIRFSEREAIVPSQGLTIETPRGGTFQMTLPDGTKVWLNAATTLHYPADFGDSERLVDLRGEAYFEVAYQKIPFQVQTADYSVNVLGTHFNIHAYAENQVKTTLLEGSVRLKSRHDDLETTLKPSEVAVLTRDSFVVKNVDPLAAVAWKNGVFVFQETSLQELLQELSRWYQVDIDSNTLKNLPDKRFNGDLPRDVTLSETLRLIRITSGIQIVLKEGRLVLIE